MKLMQCLLIMLLIGTAGVAAAQQVNEPKPQHVQQYGQLYQNSLYGQAEYFALSRDMVTANGPMSHVPEPEGWAMLLVGLGLVVVQIIRRSKRNKSWNLARDNGDQSE